jgi:RNA polymerase sigma-70 factor (ECF subfamily)
MTTTYALERESALLVPPASQSVPSRAEETSSSFEAMVAAEHAYVARLVGRLLGWRSDVDDVVQDVFVAAFCAWSKFRGDCAARTWLTRIAVNKCRSFERRRWLREKLAAVWHARQASASRVVSHPADEGETAEHVRRAVQQLRKRDREIVILHHLEQFSIAEIAAVLKISHNAVEVRLTRARQRLKGILRRELE